MPGTRALAMAASALSVAIAVSTIASAPSTPAPAVDDAYVQKALDAWSVPGLSLAVVKDDQVVAARGYGVRELGRTGAVDDRTIFAVGSTTKAFTSASVAMLV